MLSSEGRCNGGFFCVTSLGGLYLEGLIQEGLILEFYGNITYTALFKIPPFNQQSRTPVGCSERRRTRGELLGQIQGPCTTCVLRTTRIRTALIAVATFPLLSFDFKIFLILLKSSFDIDGFMSLHFTSSASSTTRYLHPSRS